MRQAFLAGRIDQEFQQIHDLEVIHPPRDYLEQDVMSEIVEKKQRRSKSST